MRYLLALAVLIATGCGHKVDQAEIDRLEKYIANREEEIRAMQEEAARLPVPTIHDTIEAADRLIVDPLQEPTIVEDARRSVSLKNSIDQALSDIEEARETIRRLKRGE